MFKRIFAFLRRLLVTLGFLGLLGLALPRLITALHALGRIHQMEDAPQKRVAVVFGAGLRRNGSPTPILRDRVAAAASLYFSGKVEKLLMSGDNRLPNYNEPEAMKLYALSLGVPEEAIILDHAGSRTYDTCFRAKAVFGLDEALLVTQKFHLPRALFLCNTLGMQAEGVEADTRRSWRVSNLIWNVREMPATAAAFLDLYITNPVPALEEPTPLFAD
jgi:SanA protein